MRTLILVVIYARDAKEGFKVSFLADIIDILEKLIRLESTFFHDMGRNPNFHSDLSDDVDILSDIITEMIAVLNIGKSGETK